MLAARRMMNLANVRTDNANRAAGINPASDQGFWNIDAGVWNVSGNRIVLVTNAAAGTPPHVNNFNLITTETGAIPQTVSVTSVRSSTSGDSAIFISYDRKTGVGYFVDFDSSGSFFWITKAVSRGGTGGAHGPFTVTPWTGGSSALQVSHNGFGVITAKQAGITVATYTDTLGGVENTTPAYGGTWCGLADFTVGPNAFDDFSVTNP